MDESTASVATATTTTTFNYFYLFISIHRHKSFYFKQSINLAGSEDFLPNLSTNITPPNKTQKMSGDRKTTKEPSVNFLTHWCTPYAHETTV